MFECPICFNIVDGLKETGILDGAYVARVTQAIKDVMVELEDTPGVSPETLEALLERCPELELLVSGCAAHATFMSISG